MDLRVADTVVLGIRVCEWYPSTIGNISVSFSLVRRQLL